MGSPNPSRQRKLAQALVAIVDDLNVHDANPVVSLTEVARRQGLVLRYEHERPTGWVLSDRSARMPLAEVEQVLKEES